MRLRFVDQRVWEPCWTWSTLLALAACFSSAWAYDAVVCGKNGYAPSTNASLSYTANAWNPVGSGFQCMSINNTPPSFAATWAWYEEPATVHSYPHVTFADQKIPVALNRIASLTLGAQWAYGLGGAASVSASDRTVAHRLSAADAVANIAFDMFADADANKAQGATTASTEIMIWIGTVGKPYPLGYSTKRTCFRQSVGGVYFTLYVGTNTRNATVFTWVTAANQTSFSQDVSPLLQYLWRNKLVDGSVQLGVVELGTEAYHATTNVTFAASNFSMALEVGSAPQLKLQKMPRKCSGASPRSVDGLVSRLCASITAICVFLALV